MNSNAIENKGNATKWISFSRLITGTLVLGGFTYASNTVMKSNQVTQRAVIELLNHGE